MATLTVTKICVICGADVAQVKRTKDAEGNYYCQPCWDKAREAQTTATPMDAGPREKNPVPLIVIFSTVGSVVVLTIAWLLFFRPSWQDQHKAQVLDLITQANSLAANGVKNEAYSKYAELFKVVGDNPITDADLQSKLTDARAAMIKLESAAKSDQSKQTPTVSIPSGASPISAATMTAVFGDQMNQFHVDKDGTISSDTEQALYLPGTEDKDFVVSGEMWLTSGQSEFSAGGIIFHLREQDGKHRYELSAGGMRAKRILLEGKQIQNIASPVQSFDVPRDQWVQFRIQVAKDGIVVLFGDQRGEARGPLSITGRNSIDFSAGGKVRNLAIQKLDPPSLQPAMDQSRTQATSGASPTDVFGDQLKQFRTDDSGAISSDVERMLVLPGTENKDFVLTGEAWLTSGASTFDAGGVLFHLRKADDKHLYILSALGLRAKRVHVEGKFLDNTGNPFQFSNMPRDHWVPFRIELAQSGMVVVFGGQRGEVRGPLTREGSNGIDLSAGGKIRNVSISPIGNASLPQSSANPRTSQPRVAELPPTPDQIAEGQRRFTDGMRLLKGDVNSSPDNSGAFQAFKNAAELGHAGAMYFLAGLYDSGDGTTTDPAEAVKWLRKSWAGGYIPAADYLGFHLENGYGVSKDTDAAFQLYRQAADTKDSGSICVLANCYLDGKIVAQNTAETLRLLTSASDSKYAPAMVHLAHIYADGKIVPTDPEKVHAYLIAAVNLHSTEAMVMWGTLYESGNTVKADQAKAFTWFLQAANAGDADAMAQLGDRYRTGNGTEASMSDAVVWYRKAAEQGHAAAAFDLGVAILTGQGTTKDPKQALDWLKKSEDWGCDKAHDAVRLAQRAVIATAIPHDRVSDYRKTQLHQYSKQLADAQKQIRVLPANSPERDEQLQVARNLTKQKSRFEDMTDDQLAEELAESDLKAIEQQQQAAQQADMDRRIEAQQLQRIQNISNGQAIGQLMKDFAEALAYYRDTQVKYNRCIARLNVLLQGWNQVSTFAVADQATKLLERLDDTNLRLGTYNKKLFDECDHAAVQQIFDAWADDSEMVKLRSFVGWAN